MKRLFILLLLASSTSSIAGPGTIVSNIHVDQFGYREAAEKIAVISQAQTGFNAPESFTPGGTYELKRWTDDVTVFTGPATAWNSGATDTQSGDRTWWFDFSSYTTEGEYYVWDPTNSVGSYKFWINDNVYNEALKVAVRTYFYQRSNFAKTAPYVDPGFADGISHSGTEQDSDCRDAANPVPATSRDLRGGWYDAGDYNKYINSADQPVHDLLFSYEENPTVFPDDWNIPESGNGVPDILDEVKYELDWFRKMQEPDGSSIHKLSVTCWCDASPPSADNNFRRYQAPTISATISSCGAFAHGARVFKSLTNPAMQAYGDTLETAAINAWNYIMANQGSIPSNSPNTGFLNAAMEDGEYEQRTNLACAAGYMFRLTGNTTYRDHIDSVWNSDYIHLRQWWWASPYEIEWQNGMLYYSDDPSATSGVSNEIRSRYQTSMSGTNHLDHHLNQTDAYNAHMLDTEYGWGSNRENCNKGVMHFYMSMYNIDAPNESEYLKAAERYVHYMHGVNPLNWTYLTNMGSFGAENSVNEFYHGWFRDGSADWDRVGTSTYGPAPGFVPGGANRNYAPDASCGCTLEPPMNQPVSKSYADWNTSYPENSWEVTENSITYQGAYIHLISKFASANGIITSSNDQYDQSSLNASPNPFTSTTVINLGVEGIQVNILNIEGRIIESLTSDDSGTITIGSDYEPGVYLAKAFLGAGERTIKIVKL